jgi:hypothetical protein
MRRINLAIVGSREITDYSILERYGLPALMMMGVSPNRIENVVSGGARGVDKFAEKLAKELWIEDPIIHKPNYEKYGRKAAPKLRNTLIVKDCDAAIVIWDGYSGGTYDSMVKLSEARKPYILIEVVVRENPHEEIIKQIKFVTEPRWRDLNENKVHPERSSRRPRAANKSSRPGPRRR